MISKNFYLAIYYLFARWLPNSHKGKFCRFGWEIRRRCAHHIFKKCGKGINIERGEWFGKGREIEINDRSGIGVNCHVPNDIFIGKDVMMGRSCYILNNTTHSSVVSKDITAYSIAAGNPASVVSDRRNGKE